MRRRRKKKEDRRSYICRVEESKGVLRRWEEEVEVHDSEKRQGRW